jgi:hypothetical protein
VIRDVTEFRRTGMASRLLTHLDVPAAAWRAAMCHAGRHDGVRVRTFLVPLDRADPDQSPGQLVFAVRTDPPPDPAVQNQGLLSWWRVDDLTMPLGRWRAALHRAARQKNVRVQTFLVPPRIDHFDDRDQVVYVVWADAADPRCTPQPSPAGSTPHPRPPPRPVTDLADYRADRLGRARSIACHPSNCSDREGADHGEGGSHQELEDVDP